MSFVLAAALLVLDKAPISGEVVDARSRPVASVEVVLTAGPARMADNFRVELSHPRTLDMKTSELFGEYTRRIYHLLGME